MEQDAAYGRLKQQVKEGVVRRYWLDGDLLVAKGGRYEERTLALLAKFYYWPKMGEDVQAYVKSYLVCQMDKIKRKKLQGCYRFSKYVVFILAPDACPAEEATKLFFSNVVKHFGLPKDIVSDRDARFTSRFWVELFKLLGSELKFFTANHP
ncbi:hypothetical protein CK203_013766 [Vitis vinifera]|uniref:Integrase zinc-binding domain-containing protein n=1 Tax=Vitis vinifera TaxID=29760 RepID=A0A438JJS1_VITVI|nr:hypothetical protein CK203_013766 [Vitis vinifera]